MLKKPQQEAEAPETEQYLKSEFDKFAEEFSEKGELSADSFTELEKMGYPKKWWRHTFKGMQAY